MEETNFIPAYLSSNDDLNNTELNTEYNTSRPLNGGHTDRKITTTLGSAGKQQRSSTTKQEKTNNLTDRDQWL